MDLSLKEIVAVLKGRIIPSSQDLDKKVQGISIDSRRIREDEVFFAIKGERFDGHDFLDEVFQKGALAAIVTQNTSLPEDGTLVIVDDTLRALQELATYYRSKFSLPVIAVTGTNGKTTTKDMIADVLSQRYNVLKSPGNLNNHLGVPLTLFGLEWSYQVAVVEMGANHFGEIERLCRIASPNYGLITNVGRGHLEFFKTLKGVASAKGELFRYLNGQGKAFVNLDDPWVVKKANFVMNITTYGFNKKADVKGEYLGSDELGCPRLRINDKVEIQLSVLGRHNIYNALAAACVGLEFGVGLEVIKRALENFQGESKRMELIHWEGVRILNDSYNSNPDSAKAALEYLAELKIPREGRRIAVLGDMLEQGEGSLREHRQLGSLTADLKIDTLLTYGQTSKATAEGALESGLRKAYHFTTKREIINFLKDFLRKGDLVLIKGSRGMAMEEVIEGLIGEGTE